MFYADRIEIWTADVTIREKLGVIFHLVTFDRYFLLDFLCLVGNKLNNSEIIPLNVQLNNFRLHLFWPEDPHFPPQIVASPPNK